MDYLITEGYPSAARKFAMEANIQPPAEEDSIRLRVEIRNAIHAGDIQKAIEKINDLNPQVSSSHFNRTDASLVCYDYISFMHHSYSPPGVDENNSHFSPQYEQTLYTTVLPASTCEAMLTRGHAQILDIDPSLHFALLRLQLIELIRTCMSNPDADITPALTFASSQLAPRAPTNPDFLEDLERTMALLIFPPENLAPPLKALLDPSLRQTVADRVNQAILSSQGARREAMIKNLVRLRAWAEQKAREAKKDIPSRLRLGLDCEGDEHEDEVMNGNGEADIMVS